MHDPKEILEICSRATEGPWVRLDAPDYGEIYASPVISASSPLALVASEVNADFIAFARVALPEFAQRVIELEEERERGDYWKKGVTLLGEEVDELKKDNARLKVQNRALVAGMLNNSNVTVEPPPIPESEVIRYSQDHIAELLRDFATCKQRTDDLYNELRRLDDENAKLRAVAEAANSLLQGRPPCPHCDGFAHPKECICEPLDLLHGALVAAGYRSD